MSENKGYVSYKELFAMVQSGRRALGLPEYKHRSSLGYALAFNRIPTRQKKGNRRKLYHAQTAMAILCPGAQAEASCGSRWATLRECLERANVVRQNLGLHPLQKRSCSQLVKKNVPRVKYGLRNYYYDLEKALAALTSCKQPEGRLPLHRPATMAEIQSGEFMPLTECARMLRCSVIRLRSAANKYYILAVRHPQTKRLWVKKTDAERVANYRTASFLYKHLTTEKAHYLMTTRPHIQHRCDVGFIVRYYVPEMSHVGTKLTAFNI